MIRKLLISDLHCITSELVNIKSQENDYKIIEFYSFIYGNENIHSKTKAFIKLVKFFHPDKLEFHNQKILHIIEENDDQSKKNIIIFLDL